MIESERNELVAVHLIKSNCLASLVCSCETWHVRSDDIRSANIAWNNSFRKVFNSFWRECKAVTNVLLQYINAEERGGALGARAPPRRRKN